MLVLAFQFKAGVLSEPESVVTLHCVCVSSWQAMVGMGWAPSEMLSMNFMENQETLSMSFTNISNEQSSMGTDWIYSEGNCLE